jgi:hypothetical protein
MVDQRILEKVNEALAENELTWHFIRALSHTFALPGSLAPLESLELDVAWGEVRVPDEALVFAVSFHPNVKRHAG